MKVNVIMWLEFKLACFEPAVQHFSCYITRIPWVELWKISFAKHHNKKFVLYCFYHYHHHLALVAWIKIYLLRVRNELFYAYSTWYSQAVTHPSTDQARRCLTSVIGQEPVFSAWYGFCFLYKINWLVWTYLLYRSHCSYVKNKQE